MEWIVSGAPIPPALDLTIDWGLTMIGGFLVALMPTALVMRQALMRNEPDARAQQPRVIEDGGALGSDLAA